MCWHYECLPHWLQITECVLLLLAYPISIGLLISTANYDIDR